MPATLHDLLMQQGGKDAQHVGRKETDVVIKEVIVDADMGRVVNVGTARR